MSILDLDDGWMNPRTSFSFNTTSHADGVFWIISRKRYAPVFGNVPFTETWETWSEFETKAERDAELQRIRSETSWIVRGDKVAYVRGEPHFDQSRDAVDI